MSSTAKNKHSLSQRWSIFALTSCLSTLPHQSHAIDNPAHSALTPTGGDPFLLPERQHALLNLSIEQVVSEFFSFTDIFIPAAHAQMPTMGPNNPSPPGPDPGPVEDTPPDAEPDSPEPEPDSPPDPEPDAPDPEPDSPEPEPDSPPDPEPDAPDPEPDSPEPEPDSPSDPEPDAPDPEPDSPEPEPDSPSDPEPDAPDSEPDSPDSEPDSPDSEPDSPDSEPDSPDSEPDSPDSEPDSPDSYPDSPDSYPDSPDSYPDSFYDSYFDSFYDVLYDSYYDTYYDSYYDSYYYDYCYDPEPNLPEPPPGVGRLPVLAFRPAMPPDNRYRDLCIAGADLSQTAFDRETGLIKKQDISLHDDEFGPVGNWSDSASASSYDSLPESISDSMYDSYYDTDTAFDEKTVGRVSGAKPPPDTCMPIKDTPVIDVGRYRGAGANSNLAFAYFLNMDGRDFGIGSTGSSGADSYGKSNRYRSDTFFVGGALGCPDIIKPYDLSYPGDHLTIPINYQYIVDHADLWRFRAENCYNYYILNHALAPWFTLERPDSGSDDPLSLFDPNRSFLNNCQPLVRGSRSSIPLLAHIPSALDIKQAAWTSDKNVSILEKQASFSPVLQYLHRADYDEADYLLSDVLFTTWNKSFTGTVGDGGHYYITSSVNGREYRLTQQPRNPFWNQLHNPNGQKIGLPCAFNVDSSGLPSGGVFPFPQPQQPSICVPPAPTPEPEPEPEPQPAPNPCHVPNFPLLNEYPYTSPTAPTEYCPNVEKITEPSHPFSPRHLVVGIDRDYSDATSDKYSRPDNCDYKPLGYTDFNAIEEWEDINGNTHPPKHDPAKDPDFQKREPAVQCAIVPVDILSFRNQAFDRCIRQRININYRAWIQANQPDLNDPGVTFVPPCSTKFWENDPNGVTGCPVRMSIQQCCRIIVKDVVPANFLKLRTCEGLMDARRNHLKVQGFFYGAPSDMPLGDLDDFLEGKPRFTHLVDTPFPYTPGEDLTPLQAWNNRMYQTTKMVTADSAAINNGMGKVLFDNAKMLNLKFNEKTCLDNEPIDYQFKSHFAEFLNPRQGPNPPPSPNPSPPNNGWTTGPCNTNYQNCSASYPPPACFIYEYIEPLCGTPGHDPCNVYFGWACYNGPSNAPITAPPVVPAGDPDMNKLVGYHMPYMRWWDTGVSAGNPRHGGSFTNTLGGFDTLIGVGREERDEKAAMDVVEDGQELLEYAGEYNEQHPDPEDQINVSEVIKDMPRLIKPQLAEMGRVGGWEELKAHQMWSIRRNNLYCIGRYEKLFKHGGPENFVLAKAGAGYTSRVGEPWPWTLGWRGYASDTTGFEFPGAFTDPPGSPPGASIKQGLDNALVGDIIVYQINGLPQIAYVTDIGGYSFEDGTPIPDDSRAVFDHNPAGGKFHLNSASGPVIYPTRVFVVAWDQGKFPSATGTGLNWGMGPERTIYKHHVPSNYSDEICDKRMRSLTGWDTTNTPGEPDLRCVTGFAPGQCRSLVCQPSCADVDYSSCVLPRGPVDWNTALVYRWNNDVRQCLNGSLAWPPSSEQGSASPQWNMADTYRETGVFYDAQGRMVLGPPNPKVIYQSMTQDIYTDMWAWCVNSGYDPPPHFAINYRGPQTGAISDTTLCGPKWYHKLVNPNDKPTGCSTAAETTKFFPEKQ